MIRNPILSIIFASFAALSLLSCANIQPTEQASESEPLTDAIPKEPLNGQSLFQLLLAEIATNRRDIPSAAALYGELGRNHNDIEAISRGVALNQSVGQYKEMLLLTERWLALRPEDPRALHASALANIANNNIEIGTRQLDKWLAIQPTADISDVFQMVDQADPLAIASFNTALETLENHHPKSASVKFSRAKVAYTDGQFDDALQLIDQSLKLHKDVPAELFRYQILLVTDTDAAAKTIAKLHNQNPADRQIAVHYARSLYTADNRDLGRLKDLHTRFSTDFTIARTYARAAFEQDEYASAQAVYSHLINVGFANEAHYYLGRIDLSNESFDSAARHFEAVKTSHYLVSALAEWVTMARPDDRTKLLMALNEARASQTDDGAMFWRLQATYFQLIDELDEAWRAFDTGLMSYPKDQSLLYDQAMLASNLERYTVLETNLQTILATDPNNINALNALGYTWADLDKNLDQAGTYIDKALTAEPDNPAFQDSKGWYLYKAGDFESALKWLKKAYAQLESDEVAAHIAEVLWHLDRPDDAKHYANEVQRLNPLSKYVTILNALFNQ